jgi:FkbM family methyltransferase
LSTPGSASGDAPAGPSALVRAKQRLATTLDKIGLLKVAERVTSPIRLPLTQRNLRRFYSIFVGPGDLVFDIGANVGAHSAALLALDARVVSVEPQRGCVEQLRRRFGSRVVIVAQAVAAEPGEAELLLSDASSERATLSHQWAREGRFKTGWAGTERVRTTTLDELIRDHGIPVFCKIDVEGFEAEVLRGLSQPIRFVSFEVSQETLDETAECVHLLELIQPFEFNFRLGQSPRLALKDWSSGEQLLSTLTGIGGGVYGDVIARARNLGSPDTAQDGKHNPS